MLLTSLVFLAFCLITLVIYFIIPKRFQWVVLLISSVIFLFYDNFTIVTVIQALVVLVTTYILGILIEKHKDTKKSKLYLILGITIILGQLICIKYNNLFVATANHICHFFDMNKLLFFNYD